MEDLPRRVSVETVLEGRYEPGKKPISWDERRSAVEIVRTKTGETLKLYSGGGQATPAPGWELLLTGETKSEGTSDTGLVWTLYGIPRGVVSDPTKAV